MLTETEWRRIVNRVRAGRALKPSTWPNESRCAVALSFDCDHEAFELGGGGTATGRLSWGEFGRRVGVPRILEILARHSAQATFFVPAVCALIDPGETVRIRDAGHEVSMHGWIHENNSTLDEATERELMSRAYSVLSEQLGDPPVGFRSANWDLSPNTIQIVKDLGLLYDSSLMADDTCYEILMNGEASGVFELPVEWIRDDAAYLLFNRQPPVRPWLTPEDVYQIFRREFDAAREEGGVFQLVMHPFVIGHRSRIWILDELIAHAKSFQDVWFGSHRSVVEWARDSCGHECG